MAAILIFEKFLPLIWIELNWIELRWRLTFRNWSGWIRTTGASVSAPSTVRDIPSVTSKFLSPFSLAGQLSCVIKLPNPIGFSNSLTIAWVLQLTFGVELPNPEVAETNRVQQPLGRKVVGVRQPWCSKVAEPPFRVSAKASVRLLKPVGFGNQREARLPNPTHFESGSAIAMWVKVAQPLSVSATDRVRQPLRCKVAETNGVSTLIVIHFFFLIFYF